MEAPLSPDRKWPSSTLRINGAHPPGPAYVN